MRARAHADSDPRANAGAYNRTDGADGSADAGADAGRSSDASADAGADSRYLRGWLARLQPDGGRRVLRCWWYVVVWLRGRVRVHRGVLCSARAAHVRGSYAVPDASVDAGTDSGTDGGPDAGADGVALLGDLARLRLAPGRDLQRGRG